MIFSHKTFYPLGLDISEKSFKLVQLKRRGGVLGIQALGWVDLPAGTIVNGDIKNEHNFLKSIQEILNKPQFGKIKSNDVVASLPEQKAFIKLLEINRSPNELPEIIETEISKHIPLSIGEMYYDWQIIENNMDAQLILAAAASSRTINEHSDLLNRAGLFVEAMEAEPISVCRSLLSEESQDYQGEYDKNYIILNFGEASVSLIFYSKDTILFSTSLPVYKEQIDSNSKQKEKEPLVSSKNNFGESVKKQAEEICVDLRKKIADLERYYENNYPGRGTIDALLICGGGNLINFVAQELKKYFSFFVGSGDVFTNLPEAKDEFTKIFKTQKNRNISSLFFAAGIGAALRSVSKK